MRTKDHSGKFVAVDAVERLKNSFFSTLEEKGFALTQETKHIAWWEYLKKCVDSYALLLEMYGINKENIHIDQNISLVKIK